MHSIPLAAGCCWSAVRTSPHPTPRPALPPCGGCCFPMDSAQRRSSALPGSLELVGSPTGCSCRTTGVPCTDFVVAQSLGQVATMTGCGARSVVSGDACPNSPRQHEAATARGRRPAALVIKAQRPARVFALADPVEPAGWDNGQRNAGSTLSRQGHRSVDPVHRPEKTEARVPNCDRAPAQGAEARIAWRPTARAGPAPSAAHQQAPAQGQASPPQKPPTAPDPDSRPPRPGDHRFG